MSETSEKAGPSSEGAAEDAILAMAKLKTDGISNGDIQNELPDIPAKIWTQVINKLLKSG